MSAGAPRIGLPAAGLLVLLALGLAACTPPDTRSADTGSPDTGSPDAGSADAASAGARSSDAGSADGGSADAPESATAPEQSAAAEPDPARAEQSAPDAAGKPTAPISIRHEWLEPPAVGRNLELEIEVGSAQVLSDVRIALNGGQNLVVDAASAATRVPEIAAGETHAFEPAVLAATHGTHYLAVSVTAVIGGAEQTRSVTIPVRLGDSVQRDAVEGNTVQSEESEAGTDAEAGERVRSLPAEERVERP